MDVARFGDATLILCGSEKGYVAIQNPENARSSVFSSKAHKGAVNCVAWQKIGQDFVSAGDDGKIKTWRFDEAKNTWAEASAIKVSESAILSLSVHPVGHCVAVLTSDASWAFVDLQSEQVLFTKDVQGGSKLSSVDSFYI